MNKPSGADILALLIKLLADQEGVEIKYELEVKKDVQRMPHESMPPTLSECARAS